MTTHPTNIRLMQWLHQEDTTIDRHLETCQRCTVELDRIIADIENQDQQHDALGAAADYQSKKPASYSLLGDALTKLLAPPKELELRLAQRIEVRLIKEKESDLITEMFTLPLSILELLFSDSASKGQHL